MYECVYRIDITKNCWGYCDDGCCYSCDYDVLIYKNNEEFIKNKDVYDDCKNEDVIISDVLDKVKKDLGREPIENKDYRLYFECFNKDEDRVEYNN